MSLLEELVINSSSQSNSSQDYLNQLSTLSLQELKQQPLLLQTTKDSLQSELSLLCFRQFKNLLINHQTSVQINNSFNSLHLNLDRFIQTTDHLDLLSKSFNSSTTTQLHSIINDRNQIKLILSHLTPFESLLELPQLISTCINNNNNNTHSNNNNNNNNNQQQHLLSNQAINLALKFHHLNHNLITNPIPSPHPIQFIQLIQLQVDRTLQSLRDHLLNQLTHSNLKLSTALRTISTLRRLSSTLNPSKSKISINQHFKLLNEVELRICFLVSRWRCLSENLTQLQLSSGLSIESINSSLQPPPQDLFNDHSSQLNNNTLKFLSRWIELWREFVGDTLSIYTDVFLNPTASLVLDHHHQEDTSKYASKQFLNEPQTALNYFLTQALNLLTVLLSHHLCSINSVASLASILTQLAYCGAAFGKSGFDFMATIFPMILERLEGLIKAHLQGGLKQLEAELKPIHPASPPGWSASGQQVRRRSMHPFPTPTSTLSMVESCLIKADTITQVLKLDPAELDEATDEEPVMRRWLGFFPPLGRFINGQLAAFNELRLLPAAAVHGAVTTAQMVALEAATALLDKLASSLAAVCGPEEGADDAHGRVRMVAHRLLAVWTRAVLPVLERALRAGIYGRLARDAPPPRFRALVAQADRLLAPFGPPAPRRPSSPLAGLAPDAVGPSSIAPDGPLPVGH